MSQLMLEFPLFEGDVYLNTDGQLCVELGNGVRLTTSVPSWIGSIKSAALQLTMEVDGSPPANANPSKPPIE